MCMVSAVGDNWRNTFPERNPWYTPQPVINPNPNYIYPLNHEIYSTVGAAPTREEFESLKKEMQELKALLLAAKHFDEKTDQHDCETDEKVELIKRIAELVGVDMKEVFDK